MKDKYMTLRLTPGLKRRMAKHREVNWSEVVRRYLADYIDELEKRDDGK
jgi:hypothetical protein